MAKYLIVGLGNIGADYAGTRHNIGFDVADALVKKHEGSFRLDRLAEVAEVRWKGKTLITIKPTTFMNLSGKAVKYWMDKEKIPLENVLIIVDELALPLSRFRLRPAGRLPSLRSRTPRTSNPLRRPRLQLRRLKPPQPRQHLPNRATPATVHHVNTVSAPA